MRESTALQKQTERFKYFVVCENAEYTGSTFKTTHEVESDDRITCMQQIVELQDVLKSQGNYKNVLIVDWKLFE